MIPGMAIQRAIVKCKNFSCGYELWSDDIDEIERWKELEELDALECPLCGGKMRFIKERGEINVEADHE